PARCLHSSPAPPPTQPYALSLHDALPILPARATAPEAFWTAAPPSGPASSLPPPARTASLFAQTGLSPRLLSAEQAAAYCGMSRDRKSTRLNSSHVKISYAVFCLKKKNHL